MHAAAPSETDAGFPVESSALSTKLTRKQNEIRLRGLRILARMIVRAHLASLREAGAGRNGSGPAFPRSSGGDIPRKEDGDAA